MTEPDYFVKKYIDTILQKDPDIDTLILGCTHYPLLLQKIRQYTPSHIRLVTQGEYVSESLKDYLSRHPDMDARCSKNKRPGVFHHRIGREIPRIGFGILTLHRRTCTQRPT